MAKNRLTDGSTALQEKQTRVITIEATEKPRDIKLRVAAYTRVSSASDDQLNSFAAQNRYYTTLISGKENWKLVDIYADEGITGTSVEKREDFQRLLADCRRGLIDRVLVKSISRFARNTKECLEALRELKLLGISVYFEKENIDTATMSGEMMTTLFASFAQTESESISGNMRWSYLRRMQGGTYIPSKLPYGYNLKDHSVQIVPEQAVIIQRIFREYLAGKSTERIATDLCKDNIPCKSGKVVWNSTAIRYILSNEKYTGNSIWQKYYSTETLPYKCVLNRGEKDSYYARGTHEGIITPEDFNRANALMKSRAQKITLPHNDPLAFQKNLLCNTCGSLYRRKIVRGIPYWVCIGHDKKRHGIQCGICEKTLSTEDIQLVKQFAIYQRQRTLAEAEYRKQERTELLIECGKMLYVNKGWPFDDAAKKACEERARNECTPAENLEFANKLVNLIDDLGILIITYNTNSELISSDTPVIAINSGIYSAAMSQERSLFCPVDKRGFFQRNKSLRDL